MEPRSRSLSPPLERLNHHILPDNIIEVSTPRYMREQLSSPVTSEISDLPYEGMENYEQWEPRIQPSECVTNYEYDHVFIDNDFTPRPPSFEGNPETWEPFLMQFRLISMSYGWSEREFREKLLLALRGEALLYASTLPHTTIERTESLLHAMKQRFGLCPLAETYRADLYKLRKQTKENLQEYSARISRLMSRAYPGMQGTAVYENLHIEYLLRGLPDQTLAYEIFTKKPKDLPAAIDIINWHEASRLITCTSAKQENIKTQNESSTRTMPKTDSNCVGTGIRCVRQTNKELCSNEHSALQPLSKSYTAEELSEKTTNCEIYNSKRPSKCYNCRRRGHLADSCPGEKTIPRLIRTPQQN